MKFSRFSLLLLLSVYLIEVDGNSMRQRFLSLRSRSNSLRKTSSTTTTSTTETYEHVSATFNETLTTNSATNMLLSVNTTQAPIKTLTLKEKLARRRPQLRLGRRQSAKPISENKSKKMEKKKTEQKKDLFSNTEPKKNKSGITSSPRGRGRFNLSLLNRRGKTLTVENVQPSLKEIEPEMVAVPKVIEMPASTVAPFRRPSFSSRNDRNKRKFEDRKSKISNFQDNFRVPSAIRSKNMKNIESKRDMKQAEVVIEPKSRNIPKKMDKSRDFKPFSFKFNPVPNPVRNFVPESQQHIPEERIEFGNPIVLIPTKSVNIATEIPPINFFENYFEAERFPSSTLENDTLITSETRTRSKIEIKEVNGTLYEYEYIYYYDDEEVPLKEYDYDLGPNELIQEPTTKSPIITTSTPLQTRSQINKVRNQANQFHEIVPEPVIDTRLRGHHLSREKSRNRENSRNIIHESVQDLRVEEFSLPTRTRFPPRPTPPSGTQEAFIGADKIALDDNMQPPLIPGITGDRLESMTLEFLTNSDIVTQSMDNLREDLTTTNTLTVSDTGAINLYALSKAVDADFDLTTTGSSDIDTEVTVSPIDYDSLYEYDFALSDFDIGTTTDYDHILVTEAETTVIPTTMPPTFAPTVSRVRLGSRFRGRGTSQPKMTEIPVTENYVVKSLTKPLSTRGKITRPRIRRPGLRSRPTAVKSAEKAAEPEVIAEKIETVLEAEVTSTSTTTASSTTVRKPSRGNRHRSRPRPSLGNRFRARGRQPPSKKENVEKIVEEIKVKAVSDVKITQAPLAISVSTTLRSIPSRRRRPINGRNRLGSNLLSRFNRRKPTKQVDKTTENPKTEEQINNATESQNNVQQDSEISQIPEESVVEKKPVTTEVPKTQTRRVSGRHRFNIPNRRRPSRRRPSNNLKPREESVVIVDKSIPTKEDTMDLDISLVEPDTVLETNVDDKSTTTSTTVASVRRNRLTNNRFRGRPSRTRGRNSVPSHRRKPTTKNVLVESTSEASTLEKSEIQNQDKVPVPIKDISLKRQRTRGRNRFIPGKRTRSSQRLSSLIGKDNTAASTSVQEANPETEEVPIEEPSAIKENKMDGEIDITEPLLQEPEGVSEPEPEPEAAANTTSEATPSQESTTEKLTRRQLLALRRSQFLG